jgi:hypothetical protein
MRRAAALALVVLLAACGKERPAESPAPATAAPPPQSTPVAAPPAAPKKPLRSTPQKCAGDGSYDQAVECVRIAAHLAFTSSFGDGELTRPTPGAERMTVRAHDGAWTAEAKPTGIVWTHDGKHATNVPQPLERLYQRLTLFPDPQKKEGSAKLAAKEGETNRYEFTDANNGDRYVVWVSTVDGHMAKLQVGAMTIGFK